jgi:osmotically-inducible protein OsmY
MNRLFPLLLGGFIALGAVGCDTAQRTSSEAPTTTDQVGEVANPETARQNQADSTSETRRSQLDADIRAREERDQLIGGDDGQRADSDLASEVRSKLEANLPASQLAVEAEDGAVKISGTVPTQEQLARIEPLAREIRGVQQVSVNAEVAPAQPQPQS